MIIHLVCADRGVPPDGTKGASAHLRSVATALAHAGHRVTAFTARDGAFPVDQLPLDRLGQGEEADVVYERYSLGHVGGLECARRIGAVLVLEVNAPLVDEATRFRPGSLPAGAADAERRLFREADVVVAVSEPLRAHVAAVRGRDEGTAVVPNGCDPSLFPRAAPLADTPEPTLVFLGHPKPWHGAERLPGVIAELRRRGVRARLLVVGGGPGADDVLSAAASAGVGNSVEVTGPVPQPAAVQQLLAASVAVAPYPRHDFFYFSPLKVVETMAAGLPVVTSDQGDLAAIVGQGGTLVPPDDDAALVDAVHRYLVDGGLRRRTGRRARQHALRDRTWEAVARQVTALARSARPVGVAG